MSILTKVALPLLVYLLFAQYGRCQAASKDADDMAIPKFPQPVIGDYVPKLCWNFTHGNRAKQEFYSPNHPGLYPNDTECVQILQAPKNFRIQLDFREFHIEPSFDCEFDYLEIRDGPYGYSPLIGRFCGKKFPPVLTSTADFLWIRFYSDDTIEYTGFKAAYKFIYNEAIKPSKAGTHAPCRVRVNTQEHVDGQLMTTEIPMHIQSKMWNTSMSVDCTWEFFADAGKRIQLYVDNFELKNPVECKENHLEVYDRTTTKADKERHFCSPSSGTVKSGSNRVYLRLHFTNNMLTTFKVEYTVFTYGPCHPGLFDCGDETCISKALVCNKRNNCDFTWDEMDCPGEATTPPDIESASDGLRYHTIILSIVGGLLLLLVLAAILLTFRQRKNERKMQKQAMNEIVRDPVELNKLLSQKHPNHVDRLEYDAKDRGRNGSPRKGVTQVKLGFEGVEEETPRIGFEGVNGNMPNRPKYGRFQNGRNEGIRYNGAEPKRDQIKLDASSPSSAYDSIDMYQSSQSNLNLSSASIDGTNFSGESPVRKYPSLSNSDSDMVDRFSDNGHFVPTTVVVVEKPPSEQSELPSEHDTVSTLEDTTPLKDANTNSNKNNKENENVNDSTNGKNVKNRRTSFANLSKSVTIRTDSTDSSTEKPPLSSPSTSSHGSNDGVSPHGNANNNDQDVPNSKFKRPHKLANHSPVITGPAKITDSSEDIWQENNSGPPEYSKQNGDVERGNSDPGSIIIVLPNSAENHPV